MVATLPGRSLSTPQVLQAPSALRLSHSVIVNLLGLIHQEVSHIPTNTQQLAIHRHLPDLNPAFQRRAEPTQFSGHHHLLEIKTVWTNTFEHHHFRCLVFVDALMHRDVNSNELTITRDAIGVCQISDSLEKILLFLKKCSRHKALVQPTHSRA